MKWERSHSGAGILTDSGILKCHRIVWTSMAHCIVSPSSGWVSITFGQDASHLHDDITQYMQHSPLQYTASSLSQITFASVHPICLSPSDLLPSKPTTHDHIIGSFSLSLAEHTCSHPWYVAPIIMERRCEMRESKAMRFKGRQGNHLETREVPLTETVLKMIWLSLMSSSLVFLFWI